MAAGDPRGRPQGKMVGPKGRSHGPGTDRTKRGQPVPFDRQAGHQKYGGGAFCAPTPPALGSGPFADKKGWGLGPRSEEHTSELQSRENLVCRLLLEKKHIEKTHALV